MPSSLWQTALASPIFTTRAVSQRGYVFEYGKGVDRYIKTNMWQTRKQRWLHANEFVLQSLTYFVKVFGEKIELLFATVFSLERGTSA